MPQIIIDNKELIETLKKTISPSGQISIGKKHAGKNITAYVVEDVEDWKND